MSHRPLNRKRAARVRKALRQTPPRHMDLVQWLLDYKHAPTRRVAREMLVAGKVKHDSHILGRTEVPLMQDGKVVMQYVAQPLVPVSVRGSITVLP